eukprot:COSAG06_NODE_15329_length_1079_cov_382.396939_1_plen_78_part_10
MQRKTQSENGSWFSYFSAGSGVCLGKPAGTSGKRAGNERRIPHQDLGAGIENRNRENDTAACLLLVWFLYRCEAGGSS